MKLLQATILTTLMFRLLTSSAYASGTTISLTKPSDVGIKDIGTLISSAFSVAIIFAILFVFGMLILGGYGWLTAGGDKAKVEEARTRITNALIGMAIVASAWVLISIIANFFGVSFTSFSIPSAAGS